MGKIALNLIKTDLAEKLSFEDVSARTLSSSENWVLNQIADHNIDAIPPIILNAEMELVDGFHRLAAFEFALFMWKMLECAEIEFVFEE